MRWHCDGIRVAIATPFKQPLKAPFVKNCTKFSWWVLYNDGVCLDFVFPYAKRVELRFFLLVVKHYLFLKASTVFSNANAKSFACTTLVATPYIVSWQSSHKFHKQNKGKKTMLNSIITALTPTIDDSKPSLDSKLARQEQRNIVDAFQMDFGFSLDELPDLDLPICLLYTSPSPRD